MHLDKTNIPKNDIFFGWWPLWAMKLFGQTILLQHSTPGRSNTVLMIIFI